MEWTKLESKKQLTGLMKGSIIKAWCGFGFVKVTRKALLEGMKKNKESLKGAEYYKVQNDLFLFFPNRD